MTAVFLDLDGTLMDSKPGILSSLGHAFRSTGHDALAATDLTWMIGPPFQDSFAKLGIANADATLAAYRDHYTSQGMYDARIYDGIEDVLAVLQDTGHRLYLMTAKPIAYAAQITAHFGLAPRMVREYGPGLDGTFNWKGDLLAHALAETGEVAANSVMVGDRHHDIAAARENAMPSIAAAWGYGGEDEWHGRSAVAGHPSELPDLIRAVLP